jgi:hypothetical protein
MNQAVAKSRSPIARILVFLSLVIAMVLASGSIVPPAKSVISIAPGCTAEKPTSIGGTIYGYGGDYNNWSVSVVIGMDLHNSSNQKVWPNGSLNKEAKYSAEDRVNKTLAQPGAPSGYDRTFGEQGSTRRLCVSSKIVTAFFEVYPKTGADTDKTYFGEAADQWHIVRPGATNTFTLRIPTGHDHGGTQAGLRRSRVMSVSFDSSWAHS